MSFEAEERRPKSGVWITAYASSSVLGQGVHRLRDGLIENRTGLSTSPSMPEEIGKLPFAACVGVVPGPLEEAPHLDPFPSTRQLRLAWNVLRQIEGEVREAIEQFGPNRVALILGTSTGGILSTEEALLHHRRHGRLPIHYSCLDGHTMDAAVRHIGISLGIRGPVFATSSACASGAKALASAKRLIDHGLADAVLAGGVDSLARMTIYGFHSLGVLSEENCRPFDESKFGMNVAEGGAWLLLQRSTPGSRPRTGVSLIGVGESSDAHHMSAPDASGASQGRAMRAALEDARVEAKDIVYVNAHGTGTKANDTAEQSAIVGLFGDRPASSTKGLLGHQLGAAGATEAIIAAEAAVGLPLCENGAIAKNVFPLERPTRPATVLSNSFAFGGANISLVLHTGDCVTPQPPNPRSLSATILRGSALSLSPAFQSISTVKSPALAQLDHKTMGTDLLSSRGRARASELTRLFAESVSWLELSREELTSIPLFIGSVLGQIQTSKNLIELFLDNDASPLAFQGSVHNTTAGVLSIALKNQKPSSSIAGGADTLFATLVEAMTYLNPVTCPRVLVLVGDESPPSVLNLPHFETAVIALLLQHPSLPAQEAKAQIFVEEKSEAAPPLFEIKAPKPLDQHICGEGLGLVDWLVQAPSGSAQDFAVVHRPYENSPWQLVVRRS